MTRVHAFSPDDALSDLDATGVVEALHAAFCPPKPLGGGSVPSHATPAGAGSAKADMVW